MVLKLASLTGDEDQIEEFKLQNQLMWFPKLNNEQIPNTVLPKLEITHYGVPRLGPARR